MPGRWAAGRSVRRAAVASGLFLLCQCGSAAAAASPAVLGSSALWSWASRTTAHALQAAQANQEVAGGAVAAVDVGLRRGKQLLRDAGPAWLRRIDLDLQVREGWRLAYTLAAVQPLVQRPRGLGRLDLRGSFGVDPGGVTATRIGLTYERRIGDLPLAATLDGGLEEHWLAGHRRLALSGGLRLSGMEISAALHDDVPDEAPGGGPAQRRIDGYRIDARTRVPFVPWAWASAGRSWQAACDAEHGTVANRVGLVLRPFLPLEIESGTSGGDGPRSWFARLRLALRLGA